MAGPHGRAGVGSDAVTASLTETARDVADGSTTATRLVEEALERLAATEPDIHAWVTVAADGAREEARRLDAGPRRGPLHGVPVGIKDIIDVAGLPTECGSPLRAGRVAGADAWVVARLREAGAVVLGKTVTTEFAYFQPGPTRNPRDLSRTPGGSSSGSAAAVAAGVVPVAVGTQTAGSVTRPAAFCGVASYVPPVGVLSYAGVNPMCPSLDTAGYFAPTIGDLALVRAALGSWTDVPTARADAPRLLLMRGDELGPVEPEMADALERAVTALGAAGARITDAALRLGPLSDDHVTVMEYESAQTLRTELATSPEQLSDVLREMLERGSTTPGSAWSAALARATAQRDLVTGMLGEADAILLPAAPGPAPEGLDATGQPTMSRPFQLMNLPAVGIPGLRSAEGLPLGIQLVGHPGREAELLATAAWVEREL
ncbi:MAG: indole acetimide hydrolase [Pseudonocardia sp. SCN 73-27]|nr:MAG: indole acetimide hydrolase [Pseudonocardia sp. SCN 73-27]